MNLPNILTIIRFFLIPVYVYIFYSDDYHLAFAIVVLAGVTDVVDGYIARKYNLITEVGKMLDPLADKCMMITVILTLTLKGLIPWVAAALFFGRDLLMILAATIFHMRGKQNVQANIFGKLTTVLFYVALMMIFFGVQNGVNFLWGVILFSLLTTTVYALEFKMINGKFFK
jgi:cardiolipin synthase